MPQVSSARTRPERTTQGFVSTLTWTRGHWPLVLLEVGWRWLYGVPACWLVWHEGVRVLASVPWQSTGVQAMTISQLLTDPMRASVTLASFLGMVMPGIAAVALWLVPLLLVAWAVVSALGRTLLLRRMDPGLRPRPLTLVLLQLVRVVPIAGAAAMWWWGLHVLARWSILNPTAAGAEPNVMLYVGGAIALSLGLFVITAAAGWVFSLAPLVAMLRNQGAAASLRDAMRARSVRSGLVEINLVLGIVKIALMVLAIVFSACPLPFESVITDQFLFWWTSGVAVWYFIASDFFHVARLVSYLHQWQAAE